MEGVANGLSKFCSARKIWPLLDLLTKKRLLELLAHARKIILLINRGRNNRLPIKSSWPLNRGSIVFCISVLIEKILVVLPFTKLFIEQGDNAVE